MFILFGIILYVFSSIHNTKFKELGVNQKKIFKECVEIFTLIPLFQLLIKEKDEEKQIELFIAFVTSYRNDLVTYLNDIYDFANKKENLTPIETDVHDIKLWKDNVVEMYKKKTVFNNNVFIGNIWTSDIQYITGN